MNALSPLEAEVMAAITDAVADPVPPLPPVACTDAVASFDRWMARSPRINRAGLRITLHALDLAPRWLGHRRRLRALSRAERLEVLTRLGRPRLAAPLAEALRAAASVAYFGDLEVMRLLGYEPRPRRPAQPAEGA